MTKLMNDMALFQASVGQCMNSMDEVSLLSTEMDLQLTYIDVLYCWASHRPQFFLDHWQLPFEPRAFLDPFSYH